MTSRLLKRYYLRVFFVIFAGVLIRILFITTARVSSNSMAPALLPGDLVVAFNLNYRIDLPKLGLQWFSGDARRGELALFFYPGNPRVHLINRIVALPGDVVQMKQNDLFINDKPCKKELLAQASDHAHEPADEKTLQPAHDRAHESDDLTNSQDRHDKWVSYTELCPGSISRVITQNDGDPIHFPMLVVPSGQVLLLPDRRARSVASLAAGANPAPTSNLITASDPVWDPVPFHNLEGRALLVLFSVSHTPSFSGSVWRVRWERLFTRLW